MGTAGQRNAYAAFVAAFKAPASCRRRSVRTRGIPPNIVVSAFKQLGPDATAAQIRDYITTLHGFGGVNGSYDFRSGDQHGLGTDSVVVVKWSQAARRGHRRKSNRR